jgi:hypothetical protein
MVSCRQIFLALPENLLILYALLSSLSQATLLKLLSRQESAATEGQNASHAGPDLTDSLDALLDAYMSLKN